MLTLKPSNGGSSRTEAKGIPSDRDVAKLVEKRLPTKAVDSLVKGGLLQPFDQAGRGHMFREMARGLARVMFPYHFARNPT